MEKKLTEATISLFYWHIRALHRDGYGLSNCVILRQGNYTGVFLGEARPLLAFIGSDYPMIVPTDSIGPAVEKMRARYWGWKASLA